MDKFRANWLLEERAFSPLYINKYESIMAQGNGYMGLRASLEEDYTKTARGLYIGGLYNKADKTEIRELPNCPDITAFRIFLNGEEFNLLQGKPESYNRSLNLLNGELTRLITWKSSDGSSFSICTKRFVSLHDKRLIVHRVEITPLSGDSEIIVETGINGRMTNEGAQHFYEVEKKVINSRIMSYKARTYESETALHIQSVLSCDATQSFAAKRRQIYSTVKKTQPKGTAFVLTKKSYIACLPNGEIDEEKNVRQLSEYESIKYDELLALSKSKWDAYYKQAGISLKSSNPLDEQAVNFALYHLNIMCPNNPEYSIAAKGLTGEGYKGHVFWDTEVFLLPFYLYTAPERAKNLLIYRFNTLLKAKEASQAKGYSGALFPWESALTGEEETPEFAAINIKTGKQERVWAAEKEHHIVADIGYAVILYYKATDDEQFMRAMGLPLLIECAAFWVSRGALINGKYHILDVIGPDEYTEHVDDNAYTNYMARYVVESAVEYGRKYGYTADYDRFTDFIARLYVPEPNEAHVVPQDSTFLEKPVIDITAYKEAEIKQLILSDYTRHEVVNMQVLKQADVVMLIYMLPLLFDKETAENSFRYYEDKTVHDSSLSMSIHSIVAADFDLPLAYICFRKGAEIDLGNNPYSSSDGIHAASIGAIWLSLVMGFGGICDKGDTLRINPRMPTEFESLTFPFVYKKARMIISIANKTERSVTIENKSEKAIKLTVCSNLYIITPHTKLCVNLEGSA